MFEHKRFFKIPYKTIILLMLLSKFIKMKNQVNWIVLSFRENHLKILSLRSKVQFMSVDLKLITIILR